jgi:hypothetical protein
MPWSIVTDVARLSDMIPTLCTSGIQRLTQLGRHTSVTFWDSKLFEIRDLALNNNNTSMTTTAETQQKTDSPYLHAGTIVHFTARGKKYFGKVVGGTDKSLRIEEIVPASEGDRKPQRFEFAEWEFKAASGKSVPQYNDAIGRGYDIRRVTEEATRGIPDEKIFEDLDPRKLREVAPPQSTSEGNLSPGDQAADNTEPPTANDTEPPTAESAPEAPAEASASETPPSEAPQAAPIDSSAKGKKKR